MKIKGGEKFVKHLANLKLNLENAGIMRVGFMEGSTNADTGTSIPFEAFMSEFGNPRVGSPPRPFFRNMIRENKGSWGSELANMLRGSNFDIRKAEERLVRDILVNQLKESIAKLTNPALSPVTVMIRGMKNNNPALRNPGNYSVVKQARKRVAEGKTNYGASDKPLVDTGAMLAGVEGDVV